MTRKATIAPTFEYPIAGLAVRTNREVAALAETGYTDGAVEILFQTIEEGAGDPPAIEGGWVTLPPEGGPQAYLHSDGKEARVVETAGIDRAQQLRRVVPFASALQGRIVLHGSGARFDDRAVVFVGRSGVGKSRLAAALGDLGFQKLSDDLLPCRVWDEEVVVPLDPQAEGPASLLLAGVFFLKRVKGIASPRAIELGKKDAVARLCRHGFGEVGKAPAWASQFPVYARLADQARTAILSLPDDLPRLPTAAARVAEICRAAVESGVSS
jgi:hypothetical protein